jgi:hypothetical protein
MYNTDDIIIKINELDKIDNDLSFTFAGICSKLLRTKNDQQSGRRIIINILDHWDKLNDSSHEIWIDIIEAAGFYPYLSNIKHQLVLKNNTAGNIRKEFHKSEKVNKYLHEEQFYLNKIISDGKNLIVSAPTSFGKSLLIEEVVASLKYKNIVIIQPTLALLDETRRKLKKYSDDYKLIIRTSQLTTLDKGNIFLLTAERVMEYKKLPKIDFLVIDEFYKLSSKRDDERADILNAATNLLLNKHNCKFYMLGPNIEMISEGFTEKYNAIFYKTDYSLVDNQKVDIYSEYLGQFGNKSNSSKRLFKEQVLFKLLLTLEKEQTLIYCSSPKKARQLSKNFIIFLKDNNINPTENNLSLVEWIKKNVSQTWSLLDCLNYRVGFHDGALQKHITSTIIDYFNRLKLSYLFCTTTIIEGVNTSAKNVIFFDDTKGIKTKIDFFDYSNIKGRSGRMMVHYIGKIYNFNEPPKKEDINIEIPFFEQNPISNEVLIQLETKDILNKSSEQYDFIFKKLSDEERMLFKNTGDLIVGQINILKTLKTDITTKQHLICWNGIPTNQQLGYILTLAWNNLLKPTESVKPLTINGLITITSIYARTQSIFALVENTFTYLKKIDKKSTSDEDLHDESIRQAFQTLRHWFQYKVPKWLNVINEIQTYLCLKMGLKPGNYSFYASQIENDFIRENLSILYEYGVPKSAITTLEKFIPLDLNEDEVISLIKNKKYYNMKELTSYEKEKIIEVL